MIYDGYSYPAVRLEDSEEWVPEAFIHQVDVLPHLIEGDLRELFPQIQPAEDPEGGMPEQADWLEQRAVDEGLVNSPVCLLSIFSPMSPRRLSRDSCENCECMPADFELGRLGGSETLGPITLRGSQEMQTAVECSRAACIHLGLRFD